MLKQASLKTVSIRPGVSVLSVLRHLNYRAWFALAEFVDTFDLARTNEDRYATIEREPRRSK